MKLYLVRHGETRKNVEGRLHAAGDPEVLNENGKAQIGELANKLKGKAITKIYSSHEGRAKESAQILADQLNLSVEEVDGLQERSWGVYTDKPWSEVAKILEPMSLEERYNYVPKGGESWKSFETRLINAINKIAKENAGDVVVVTHGGAIRALMPYLLNVPKEESFKYDPENASVKVFEYDNGNFKITDMPKWAD